MLMQIKKWLASILHPEKDLPSPKRREIKFTPRSEDHLLLFPPIDSKANYLEAFWKWVGMLEQNDFQRAIDSLCFVGPDSFTPELFESRIKTFYGGDKPWSVVIPNERLINVINQASEIQLMQKEKPGWFLTQIPLTNEPEDPKRDDILLMGLAVSFHVVPWKNQYALGFEIFHL